MASKTGRGSQRRCRFRLRRVGCEDVCFSALELEISEAQLESLGGFQAGAQHHQIEGESAAADGLLTVDGEEKTAKLVFDQGLGLRKSSGMGRETPCAGL